ncbi:MAG: hypothetical protein EA422_07175 [Gemmatimonadales bacterium]|nr:MAG: hypothetical protein EA422_07175 [Gemmatimonadales bacterium]
MLNLRFTHLRRAGPGPSGLGPALAVGLLAVGLAGCFSYQPVLDANPEPDADVRLRLAAPAAVTLSERTGRSIRSVEGTLLAATPDSLTVEVRWGAVYAGTPFEGRRDILAFHRSEVLEIDRREFSRTRTGIVAAGLTGVALLILRSFLGGGGDAGGVGPGDGDPL